VGGEAGRRKKEEGRREKGEGRREKGGKSLFLLTIYAPIC
jgi:hypothetical protein